jgi:hypothetical protein
MNAGTLLADDHLWNFALLHVSQGEWRLAPALEHAAVDAARALAG